MPGRGRGEAGSTSYELVLLMPVLILMVLFVLWAGRTGQARLAAELAAEEAATAAAVCCSADEVDKREAVVGAVLAGRPEIEFLCINEPRPLDGYERFVSDSAFFFDGTGGSVNGVGVLGVGFECVTDGAVGVLGGVLGETAVRARAAEVVQLPPRAAAIGVILPKLTVADVRTSEIFEEITFTLVLDRPADAGYPVTVWWKTVDGPNTDPEYNATSATRSEFREFHRNVNVLTGRFDFCANQIYDEMFAEAIQDKDDFDPGESRYAGTHRDYLRVAPSRVLFGPGETTKKLTLEIADDCLFERAEQFGIELFNASNVVLSDDDALATILNDDDQPYLGFLNSSVTADEDAGDFEVELVLRDDDDLRVVSGVAVSGRVTTSDGAAKNATVDLCPADYVELTSTSQAGAFELNPMEAGDSAEVTIADDDILESSNEDLTVNLYSLTGALRGPTSTTITIIDDDDAPYVHLVEPDDGNADRTVEKTEGTDPSVSLGFRLYDDNAAEIGSGLAVTVNYRPRAGTATEGPDPTDPNSNLDFELPSNYSTSGYVVAACKSASTLGTPVKVDIRDDTLTEGDEEFTVQLNPIQNAATDPTRPDQHSITVRICDDDRNNPLCPTP